MKRKTIKFPRQKYSLKQWSMYGGCWPSFPRSRVNQPSPHPTSKTLRELSETVVISEEALQLYAIILRKNLNILGTDLFSRGVIKGYVNFEPVGLVGIWTDTRHHYCLFCCDLDQGLWRYKGWSKYEGKTCLGCLKILPESWGGHSWRTPSGFL